jgi:hypothetical protein
MDEIKHFFIDIDGELSILVLVAEPNSSQAMLGKHK